MHNEISLQPPFFLYFKKKILLKKKDFKIQFFRRFPEALFSTFHELNTDVFSVFFYLSHIPNKQNKLMFLFHV